MTGTAEAVTVTAIVLLENELAGLKQMQRQRLEDISKEECRLDGIRTRMQEDEALIKDVEQAIRTLRR